MMLPLLDEHPLIGEILIINNNRNNIPKWFATKRWKKVKVNSPASNIYVNPAFNIGIKAALNDKICLLQDDVLFDPAIFDFVHPYVTEDKGCIGCDPYGVRVGSRSQIGIVKITKNIQLIDHKLPLAPGYAVLMFLHKSNYLPISDDFKIHFGENWIYYTHTVKRKTPRVLKNFYLMGLKTMTTSSAPEFREQAEKEMNISDGIRKGVNKLLGI